MNRQPRTIYLVRHGKIQLPDDQRRYVGHYDAPLDEIGIQQARCLQQRLARVPLTAAYCSDLARSSLTAEIIIHDRGIPLFSRQDLREIHLGEWEGRTFSDIEQRFPDEFRMRGSDIVHYRIPGGESFADCSKRALAAIRYILKTSTGNILIVGHAGVNRVILCHCMHMPLRDLFKIRQEYGCMNVIQESINGTPWIITMDE